MLGYEKLIGLAGVLKKFKDIKKNSTIGLNKVKLPIGGTKVTLLANVLYLHFSIAHSRYFIFF